MNRRCLKLVIPQLAASAVALMILTGCGGGGSDEAGNGKGGLVDPIDAAQQAVYAAFTEPPGSNCKQGGTRIDSGFDTNGNGVLDYDEATTTRYSCGPI